MNFFNVLCDWPRYPERPSPGGRAALGAIMALGLAIRLHYRGGLSLGDDAIYLAQVLDHALANSWPPEHTHWQTRLGMTLPAALCVKLFGTSPLAIILWPLAASLAKIAVCYEIAKGFANERIALLSAAIQATFPLEVLYGTHLFPDSVVGLLSTLALWAWILALRSDDPWLYATCGAFCSLAYLTRETVIMDAPIFLGLWALEGRFRRARLPWVFVAPAVVLVVECSLYAATTGSALYRWTSIHSIMSDSGNAALNRSLTAGGGFWSDPLMMAIASHEFGLYFFPSLLAGVYGMYRWAKMRPLCVWLILGFSWLSYGTTLPTGWVPLTRDPRYFAVLTVPASILLANSLSGLRAPARLMLTSGLILSGLFAASLDHARDVLAAHHALLEMPFAEGAIVEPFEYIGVRWSLGLDREPRFACADDCGRPSIYRRIGRLRGTRLGPRGSGKYFVFCPGRRPDLLRSMAAEGWDVVAEIPGRSGLGRLAVSRALSVFPSQRARADRIAHPSGLVVMARHGMLSRHKADINSNN